MRLKNLILWNIKLQARYGFYLLYSLLTVLYIIILLSLPDNWKVYAAAIAIFSDPAAMGLFFMGAVILLEKSERISCTLAISPICAAEYILAKIFSFEIIALIVAAIISISVNTGHLLIILIGTALSNALFTLLGIIIGTKIISLNQFILWTVPVGVFTFVPGILHLSGLSPAILKYYPTNICMDMIAGKTFSLMGVLFTAILIGVLFLAAHNSVTRMWQEAGGLKL